jgi:hypothetical protein
MGGVGGFLPISMSRPSAAYVELGCDNKETGMNTLELVKFIYQVLYNRNIIDKIIFSIRLYSQLD